MATPHIPRRRSFPSHEAFDAELVPDADAAHGPRSAAATPTGRPDPAAEGNEGEAFEVVLDLPPGSRGFEEGRRRIEVRASAIAAVRGSLLSW